MSTCTFGGARYIVGFIHNYTHSVTIYLLKEKSKIVVHYKILKSAPKNKLPHTITCLHTNNGAEYVKHSFSKLQQENDINYQTFASYSPQPNGPAEQMNKTLVVLAWCMLHNNHNMNRKFTQENVDKQDA